MSYEGAILGGYLLPRNEFVSLMTLLLKERFDEIIELYLKNILSCVIEKNIKGAYQQWELLQLQVFKNPKVELLAMINYTNTGLNTEYIFTEEEPLLTKSGNISLARLKSIDDTLKNIQKYQIISEHLEQMINSTRNNVLTRGPDGERNYIYDLPRGEYRGVKKRLSDIRWNKVNTKPSYLWVIYGAKTTKGINARGKIADAFLNHMGKMHNALFNSSGGLTELSDFSSLPSSVREEENASQHLGFLHLLLESLNSTPWFTGGDLITVDKTGKINLNIQLKTSKRDSGTVGEINYVDLANWLKEVLDTFSQSQNYQAIAEIFYEHLKTSTVSEALGDDVIKSAYDLAAKELGLKFAS